MTTRKQRSPKGKGRGKRRKPGLAARGAAAAGSLGIQGAGLLGVLGLRGATALGGMIGRYPSIAGGAMAFGVIFSFVAANALWYQPGAHPSPLFRTRDPAAPYSLGHRPFFAAQKQDAANTTTFRIERPADQAAAAPASAPGQPMTLNAAQMSGAQLIAGVQTELGRRGVYNGPADGVMGPKTSAAIIFFQETIGMAQTGQASPELLAALQQSDKTTSTVPAAAPHPAAAQQASAPAAKAPDVDPVAAAILNAEGGAKSAAQGKAPVVLARSAPQPLPRPTPVSLQTSGGTSGAGATGAADAAGSARLVMRIQQGLSNIAYSNVSVDGVAGEQTKAAILRFQRHYRLPETGEPDVAVLKKLQDIGAL